MARALEGRCVDGHDRLAQGRRPIVRKDLDRRLADQGPAIAGPRGHGRGKVAGGIERHWRAIQPSALGGELDGLQAEIAAGDAVRPGQSDGGGQVGVIEPDAVGIEEIKQQVVVTDPQLGRDDHRLQVPRRRVGHHGRRRRRRKRRRPGDGRGQCRGQYNLEADHGAGEVIGPAEPIGAVERTCTGTVRTVPPWNVSVNSIGVPSTRGAARSMSIR